MKSSVSIFSILTGQKTATSSTDQAEKEYKAAHGRWVCQVNVNYHDGHMTLDEAEALAGPEPQPYMFGLPSNGYIS